VIFGKLANLCQKKSSSASTPWLAFSYYENVRVMVLLGLFCSSKIMVEMASSLIIIFA
jgi:hypothetical protein